MVAALINHSSFGLRWMTAFTRPILGLLNRDELKAVLGHEMGHIKHNDMIVTAAVSVVPIICYYIALSFMFSRDNEGGAFIIGILGYVFYLVGQLLVLFISRTREYYADEASDVNTNRAFFINDINNARNDLNDFSQIDFDGDGSISDEELKKIANSNINVSTSNKLMELLSTHPDSLKRVKRLSELEN